MTVLTWSDVIGHEKEQVYFRQIMHALATERAQGNRIYPPQTDMFNAFKFTPFENVSVVILGQDPYHGAGQAHGLAFSVHPDMPLPPSLSNIYKELQTDIPTFTMPKHGYLASWAKQGVLLLNTVLSVQAGKAHSHAKIGWETFTDRVIEQLNDKKEGLIFLLWGAHAQRKGAFIERKKHHVLAAPHPSPLSAHRGFLGCKHFSQTNTQLALLGKPPIDWQPKY